MQASFLVTLLLRRGVKVRKTAIFLFILVFFFGFYFFGEEKKIDAVHDFDLFSTIASSGETLDITGWSLHARKKLDNGTQLEDVKEHAEQLKKKFPEDEWQWNYYTDQEKWKATAVKKSSSNLQENIQIISTLTKDNPQAYIIYEVQEKNSEIPGETRLKELDTKIYDIFWGNATIYTCIYGRMSAMMNKSMSEKADFLVNLFHAKKTEKMEEENFISISAYSSKLKNAYYFQNQKMNLQIALRSDEMGGITTFVIGTPIITIEY